MENMKSGLFGRREIADSGRVKARLNTLAWALLLILCGVALLLRHTFDIGFNEIINTVEIGVGVIFLGVNVAGHFLGIEPNTFWSAVGILLIADGIDGVLSLDIPVFALALITLGTWMILKSRKRTES